MRAFRQIREDGIGFREDESVVVEYRRAAVGVDFQEFGSAAFTFEDIDFDDFARDAELRQQQTDFVRVESCRSNRR